MSSEYGHVVRAACVFLAAVLFYGAVMSSRKWAAHKQILLEPPQHRINHDLQSHVYDDSDGDDNDDDADILEQILRTSMREDPKLDSSSTRNRSIPHELYHMAQPVFDSLPEQYLPDYKSPCWWMNGKLRCLPYFYILGMPKCGTSDLWDKISQHPHVERTRKEPHWWTRKRLRGETFQQYLDGRSNGMLKKLKHNSMLKSKLIVGDGSASTFWDNHKWRHIFDDRAKGPRFVTADIIKAVQPQARLLLIVREPVSRLYSGYLYFQRNAVSAGKFHELVKRTINAFQNCTKSFSARACAYDIRSSKEDLRLTVGLYAVYVRDWLRVFPKEQLFILRLKDWHAGCNQLLPQIYDFLGLEPVSNKAIAMSCRAEGKNSNKAKAREVGAMLNKTRALLMDFYADYNRALSELLQDSRFLWKDAH